MLRNLKIKSNYKNATDVTENWKMNYPNDNIPKEIAEQIFLKYAIFSEFGTKL